MKSYVILFCILVYCSKIVESNPLSEGIVIQRASKNINLPAENARQQYENADIARPQNVNPSYEYRQPSGQQFRQQWQNNGNYRPYNQFKPRQPEKNYYRNGFNNKNWVYRNQPAKFVRPAPVALNSPNDNTLTAESFISSASVENQRVNNMEYIPPVKPEYYQGELPRKPAVVFQKPVVQEPSLTPPKYIVPANNQPLEIVVSKRPVQTIVLDPTNSNLPENINSLINSERVHNALIANNKRRGYLIVHPNGTLEQIDEIEEIHKNHPNYFMVNVGDYTPNQSSMIERSTTPGPLSTVPIVPALIQATPRPLIESNAIAASQAVPVPLPNNVASPMKPIGYPKWNYPYYRPYNGPVGTPNGATAIPPPYNQNGVWPGYKPKDIDNNTNLPLNFYTNPASPALPLLIESTPMPNIATTQSLEDEVTTPKLDEYPEPEIVEPAVVSEDAAVTSPSDDDDNDSTTPVVPTAITIASTPLDDTTSPSDDAPTTVPTPTTQSSITSDVTPDVTSDVLGDDETDVTSPVLSEITTSKPDEDLVTAPGAVTSDSTTPTPIVNIPLTTAPTTETSDITTPDVDDDNGDDDDDDEIITLSPIENPINDVTNEADGATVITATVVEKTDSIAKPTIIDENSIVKSPCPLALKEAVAEIDMSDLKTTTKPVVWFKTTKDEFWDKLTTKKDYDVIYFMQMHPQPIIEKDSKTTVFPNGTIYEEITETKWESREDPEPKVTKTIKITQ